jgi:hypothetical protein
LLVLVTREGREMIFIQFRVHPSVGMARIGPSKDFYFLGPEIPRFIQEQFANLRHTPQPLRHPATTNPNAEAPKPGRYRDNPTPTGRIMPQAARFRVFAYVYDGDKTVPDKVIELTTDHAEIEWVVTLANAKSVILDNQNKPTVDLNQPLPQLLSTKESSPHIKCQIDPFPNLAWLTLEKDAANRPTGRLHIIGNEGNVNGGPYKPDPTLDNPFPAPDLFQNDWYDSAADGSVEAVVELKPAFTSQFSGAKYLIPGQYLAPGQADTIDLPANGRIQVLPAWVVVNMPDYVPDMGHFVSLWDLALNQAWNYVFDPAHKAKTVLGQHRLVGRSDLSSYAFYDYYVHIHPQLGLFSDVAYVSGQARAGALKDKGFFKGVILRGTLTAAAGQTDQTIKVKVEDGLRIKAASLDQSFLVLLSANPTDPLSVTHEFVRCSAVKNGGELQVTRGQENTASASWPAATTHYFAATKGAYVETPLTDSIPANANEIKVDVQSAYRMPEPNARDAAFKVAVSGAGRFEWMTCTANAKTDGKLSVNRGVDGTTARPWGLLQDNNPVVIAAALGHKTLDARAHADELAAFGGGSIQKMLFKRLRLPKTVYDRPDFKRTPDDANTPFPREFGRRLDIEVVAGGSSFFRAVNVDPGGSLSRFHDVFVDQRTKSCRGRSLPADEGKAVPDKLHDEDYKEDLATHVQWLDDYYWIVSERDMPMLKELAFTHMQFRHFDLWANGFQESTFNPEPKHLFQRLFKRDDPQNFFNQSHSLEEYINELLTKRSRHAPAFLDMASMGKMLGGSFLPGIEVGREAGKPENWTLYHGGTIDFPDVRFHPKWNDGSEKHPAGTLTKDLAVPWFADYIECVENFWPTSRPQVVYDKVGVPYPWLSIGDHAKTPGEFTFYWTKLGFIRRQAGDKFAEEESIFPRP